MKKEIQIKQSEIFEKIVTGKDGVLFRVLFVVVQRAGVLRGKILSCELLKKEESPLLSAVAATSAPVESPQEFIPVCSPFSYLDFLTSIQIRAPSTR